VEVFFVKVLINSVSVKEGGALVVQNRLLAAMSEIRPDIEWVIAAHPSSIPSTMQYGVTWLQVPGLSSMGVIRWYERGLPAAIKEYGVDVLFSQTNYLPRRRLLCPSLLLIQHAGHFSSSYDQLMREFLCSPAACFFWALKRRWVHRSAEQATLLTVQTAALADAISEQTARPRGAIEVIPHGPGLAHQRKEVKNGPRPELFRIGYVSKWGVQKNFSTLFAAAALLRTQNYQFKLVVTLDESLRGNQRILETARVLGVADLIENKGEVAPECVEDLFDTLDIVVFPSLCESFGMPNVEAMARGLPLIVAATKENIEVTRGAALDFPPMDAAALAARIGTLIDNDAERTWRAELSLEIGGQYSWRQAAEQTIRALDSLMDLRP